MLGVLIDTGSTRSLISHEQFKLMQLANSGLSIMPVTVHCVTASGQSLRILGEVVILVKIVGFTWKFHFLVSQRLWGPPILGMHFMIKTQLVLDVARRKCHFAFAPKVVINLSGEENARFQVHTISLQGRAESEIVTGSLTPQRKHVLLRLIKR
jgi:hypothetical protein